jgi:hypothetical protein
MNAWTELLSQVTQPREAGVCRLGYTSLDVKVENRFGLAAAQFGQATPPGVSFALYSTAAESISDEIDVGVVLIGRPVLVKIVEKTVPVGRQVMVFEVSEGE